MHIVFETLRETFTVYLAAGVMFSGLSVWAAIKALRVGGSEIRPGHR